MRDVGHVVAEVLTSALGREIGPNERVFRENEEKWDSVKHIEIMFAVEAALQIRFSEEELVNVSSSDELKRFAIAHHET